MENKKIISLLTKEIPITQISLNEPMKKHTSFKIGGNADIFVKVKKIEELEYLIKTAIENNIYITIIGNGSNLLVKDKGIRGIVAKIEIHYIDIQNLNDNDCLVRVGSGVKLAELAQILLKEKITGFEFASGIPGTIGGAIRMNAGAYGGEMKDLVVETKCLNLEDYKKVVEVIHVDDIEIAKNERLESSPKVEILSNSEQEFSYRNSIFNNKKYIIIETTLKLKRGNQEEIKARMDEYLASRKEKQPIDMPSAGSTFKRGEDFITAKLIDECGLKGYCIGGAEVSTKHAGFIVNKGSATAKDVIDLIKYIQKKVYEKTGKNIDLEVEIVGE